MIQFEITNLCNLRCLHCYHLESLKNMKGNTDLDDEKTLLIMQKILDSEIFALALTGGEPLFRKNILLNCIQMCKGKKLALSINTNLLLLDDEIMHALGRVTGILISCPSIDPDKYNLMTRGGSFKKFENNLIKLINYFSSLSPAEASSFDHTVNLPTSRQDPVDRCCINMVVNKRNLNDVRKTASRMKEIGVKGFYASPMTIGSSITTEREYLLTHEDLVTVVNDLLWVRDSLGLSVDIADALPKCAFSRDILEKDLPFLRRACSAGISTAQVSSRGDVRPCPDSQDSFGNILHESMEEIYARMEKWRNGDLLPDECKECAVLEQCNGGCRVQAYNCTHDRKGKDPWMTEKITRPLKIISPDPDLEDIEITEDMEVSFDINSLFKRQEIKNEDVYLIFNMQNMRSIWVKKHCLEFIQDIALNLKMPTTVKEVANYYNIDFSNKNFQKVMKYLVIIDFVKTTV